MFLRSLAQRSMAVTTHRRCRPRRTIRPATATTTTTTTTAATRSVWHSGYLDQQQADDLVQAIETSKKELQALKTQVQATQEELDNLNKDYTNLTGEYFDSRHNDMESLVPNSKSN